MDLNKYNSLEVARILGEPRDPRKPYPDVVSAVCQTATAEPNDYHYYYDVLLETDKVITITGGTALTTENVTPDTPAEFTFIDISSPEYYIKITDLASAKEATMARKLDTINRALNSYESYYIITLASAAASTASHEHTLFSGQSRFSYNDLIFMIDDVIDYGDNYTLIVGATLDQDMKLWDWNDNKYQSMVAAFGDLGVTKMRLNGTVTIDSSATSLLSSTVGYLVANSTTVGKPFLFVRKRLSDIDLLGGAIKQGGDKPERLVFVSPNPIAVNVSGTTTRYLAVGLTGYEEIVAACINPYAISKFTRS
jgi:hypothetical protein